MTGPGTLHVEEPPLPFDVPAPAPTTGLSPTQRRTARQRRLLASGVHPTTLAAVDPDPTRSCGTCAHHFENRRGSGRIFHKCDLRCSRGPATDLRLAWPACVRWEPRKEPDG